MFHFPMAQPRNCRGFSLLELLAVLTLLTGLVSALLYKTFDVSVQVAQQNTGTALAAADEQLRQFAAWNGRLPCPDTTGNGIEDCSGGAQKGNLPYRTLGLAAIGYAVGEQGGRAMRYGVYRNPTEDADLAVTAERFKPTNADGTAYDLDNKNTLDFCEALEGASALSQNDNYLHISHANDTTVAMAYMLASPGTSNADDDNKDDRYDGLNASSTPGFNAPQTPVSANYDDITQGRGLTELYSLLHCEASQRSLNLAANAIALEEENIAFAESNKDNADQGVMMNAVGSALTAWSLGQAVAGLIGAVEVQSASSALLATATATCVPPLVAGCPFVPVYTGALSFATSGANLSATAVGLSTAALGLQVTSALLYDGIAEKAGPPEIADGEPGTSEEELEQLVKAREDLEQAENAIATAENEYATANDDYEAKKTAAEASRDALETEINKLSDENKNKALDRLYGKPRPPGPGESPPEPDPENDVTGVEPAIKAWISAAEAEQRTSSDGSDDNSGIEPINTDIQVVDADGNPVLDAEGNPVTLDESTQGAVDEAAKGLEDAIQDAADAAEDAADAEYTPDVDGAVAKERIETVRSELETYCTGDACASLLKAYDAHVGLSSSDDEDEGAYTAEQRAFYKRDALKFKGDAARDARDSALNTVRALECASDGEYYDPESNSCTTEAPDNSAKGIVTGSAICTHDNEAYDEKACNELKDAQEDAQSAANPLCDEGNTKYYNEAACAALVSNPARLELFRGMESLVEQLDDKGTVQ